jgi:SNF2 family DNA or RNA helicase
MVDEVHDVVERALIFTQYAEMGGLLQGYLREYLLDNVLFLHGGTPAKKREEMVRNFQSPYGPPVFILSLKAGGTGLNLTNANHVFHFDRWYNPAIENQATDRAFRIGQTKNVQVHKFICLGTLEERIDELIERKQAFADQIVGSGESWISEMDNNELRDLVTLRREMVEG